MRSFPAFAAATAVPAPDAPVASLAAPASLSAALSLVAVLSAAITALIPLALLALAMPLAAAPAAAAPALQALADWKPGRWQNSGAGQRAARPAPICLSQPDLMLLGGRTGKGCRFSTISDTKGASSITYQCPDGRQGRTDVRRDTGDLYTIDAQGLDHGLPFATRTEWERIGSC